MLLTTCFNFQEYQARSANSPSFPSKNTSSPPCEPPHFKFANEASLKQIKAAFYMSSISGNDKTAYLRLVLTKRHKAYVTMIGSLATVLSLTTV